MARSSNRTYDPKTGTWTKSSVTVEEPKSTKDVQSSSNEDKLTSSTTDSSSSAGKTEKKYNTITYNLLEGSISYIANKDTIKLKVGDTITLKGLGINLSGKYYVDEIVRTFDSNGYSHTATVINTNFGDSLKVKTVDNTLKKESVTISSTKKDNKDSSKTHVLQKGETLWKLAIDYYKDGSKYPKIAKANNLTEKQFNCLPIGSNIIIP